MFDEWEERRTFIQRIRLSFKNTILYNYNTIYIKMPDVDVITTSNNNVNAGTGNVKCGALYVNNNGASITGGLTVASGDIVKSSGSLDLRTSSTSNAVNIYGASSGITTFAPLNCGAITATGQTIACGTITTSGDLTKLSGNLNLRTNLTTDTVNIYGSTGTTTFAPLKCAALTCTSISANGDVNGIGNLGCGAITCTNITSQSNSVTFGTVGCGIVNSSATVNCTTLNCDNLRVSGIYGIKYSGGENYIRFYWTGAQLQYVIDGTAAATIAITSDYRIKRNVTSQNVSALPRIMKLRPVLYQHADYKVFKSSERIMEGFIAHELQEIIPSAVDGQKDDPDVIQSLRLDALCSVLTKGVQELVEQNQDQQTQITELQTTVVSQQSQIDSLTQQLADLKAIVQTLLSNP